MNEIITCYECSNAQTILDTRNRKVEEAHYRSWLRNLIIATITMVEVTSLPTASHTNANTNIDTPSVVPELVCELCSKTYQRRTFILPPPLFITLRYLLLFASLSCFVRPLTIPPNRWSIYAPSQTLQGPYSIDEPPESMRYMFSSKSQVLLHKTYLYTL